LCGRKTRKGYPGRRPACSECFHDTETRRDETVYKWLGGGG
jgi:hypothetical protein